MHDMKSRTTHQNGSRHKNDIGTEISWLGEARRVQFKTRCIGPEHV